MIKVAVAYKDPETGKELDYFPADLGYLEKCEVVYKEFEGWQTSTTAVKTFVCASLTLSEMYWALLMRDKRPDCLSKRRRMSGSSRSSRGYP